METADILHRAYADGEPLEPDAPRFATLTRQAGRSAWFATLDEETKKAVIRRVTLAVVAGLPVPGPREMVNTRCTRSDKIFPPAIFRVDMAKRIDHI